MRKFVFIVLLLVTLAGCTTNPSHGNFVLNSPAAYDQKMANDAVKRLIVVYPPARTRFDLQQVTPDAFGTALVASLRTRGYALMEFQSTSSAQATKEATGLANASDATLMVGPLPPTLRLRYVIDLDPVSNLYRVTLEVGNQSLTRAYLAQNGSVYPAGAWVHKE